MKLGVFTVLYADKDLNEMLDIVVAKGIESIELGTGGYPGDVHCKVDELLNDKSKQKDFLKQISSRGLIISALSCHSNPLHPQKHISNEANRLLDKTVQLASQLEIPFLDALGTMRTLNIQTGP